MAWGASKGLEDVCARLQGQDAKLASLHIMRFRRVNEQDVASLCEALAVNTVLTELSCSCHPLSAAAAGRFGGALAVNSTLRSVSIGNSVFGDEGLAAMAPGLAANTGLTHLDLEQKGLTAAGARSLAPCLEKHPALERLVISRNDIGSDGVSALCVRWRALRRLDLEDCGLTADAAAALAAAPGVSALTHLSLSGNGGLGPVAGGPLGRLVVQAGCMQVLELRGAQLGLEGAVALAAALPAALSLRTLDLSNCRLSPEGCGLIAAGAAQQRKGAASVAAARAAASGGGGEAAAASSGLQRLVLGPGNGLEDGGVRELADALSLASAGTGVAAAAAGSGARRRAQPLDLDLSGCCVAAPAVAALSRLPGLRALGLFGGSLLGGAVEALCGALAAAGDRGPEQGPAQGGAVSPPAAAAAGGGAGAGPFSDLRELNLAGCGLALGNLTQLLGSLDREGPLRLVEVGANPGADEPSFQEAAAALRERRPQLDVHWRAADGSGEGAGPMRPQQ